VCLVQQTHDALLLACDPALLLCRRRLRRGDTVGGRLWVLCGWRVRAQLTWIAVGAALARCDGVCCSKGGGCAHAASTAFGLAARVTGTAGSVCTMVLDISEPAPAAFAGWLAC
jgi:hypothetical protein